MSKTRHTSKVSESAPNISLIERIKALFGFGIATQESDQGARHADESEVADPATHDRQKIWKKQIGAILPQRKTDPILPVKHSGDREGNQTPSNLG